MARLRIIKPEFWHDEKICTCSRDARLTFLGLLNQSDDYGVVRGATKFLKNSIFPYDNIEIAVFEEWIKELESIKIITPFVNKDEKYIYIKNFTKHQTINKPSTQRNPIPPKEILTEGYYTTTTLLPSQIEVEVEVERENKYICDLKKFFEEFWQIYPSRNGKKLGKAEALKFFTSKIKDEEVSLILQAVRNYASSTGCRNGYAKDAIRFLRCNFWKDWIEPEKINNKGGDNYAANKQSAATEKYSGVAK